MSWSYPNLQKKFKSILIEHGQDVLLRRRCISCSQSSPNARYDDTCRVCGGTGYHQTLERYTMRKQIVGTDNSFPNTAELTNTGMKLQEGTYFFCEGAVKPKYGDLIYDWNNATDQFDVYEISKVLERRYGSQQVLFFTCASEIKVNLL